MIGAASMTDDIGAQHRLAAVVFLDVAGYTRLMEQDEEGTHRRWMAMRAASGAGVLAHGGQVVKSTGDGLLLLSSSGIAAV
jgi:adenylate cyclase